MKKALVIAITLIMLISTVSYDSFAFGDQSVLNLLPIDSPLRTTHNFNLIAISYADGAKLFIGTKQHIQFVIDSSGKLHVSNQGEFVYGDVKFYHYPGGYHSNLVNASNIVTNIQNDNLVFHSNLIKNYDGDIIYPLNYNPEKISILSPNNDSTTVNKKISFIYEYEINGDKDDYLFNVKSAFNTPISSDQRVKMYSTISNTYYPETAVGQVEAEILFNDDYIGNPTIRVELIRRSDNEVIDFDEIQFHIKEFEDLNNDGLDDQTNEPETATTEPNEFIYITNPREGYKTIDKFIQYSILYKIQADAISDLNINILNKQLQSLDLDNKVDKYTITFQDAELKDGYVYGELRLLVEYKNITSNVGLFVKIKNISNNRQLSIERNCELVPFIDANNDGIDDNTGQDQYIRPDIPDLDNLSLSDSVDALKNVIPTLTSFIGSIVGLIAIMFGWLPAPVVALMVTIMLIIGVTTLLKVLRG